MTRLFANKPIQNSHIIDRNDCGAFCIRRSDVPIVAQALSRVSIFVAAHFVIIGAALALAQY